MRLAEAMDSVEEEDDSLVVAQDVGDGADGDEVVGGGRGAREGEGASMEVYRWRNGVGRRRNVGVLILCEQIWMKRESP